MYTCILTCITLDKTYTEHTLWKSFSIKVGPREAISQLVSSETKEKEDNV